MPEPNPIHPTLVQVADAAVRDGLRFLLVGGNAVIHFGVPRFTRDIDLLIPAGDVVRWRTFLECLGYRMFHGTGAFAQFESTSSEPGPAIDLMLVDERTWEKLQARSRRENLTSDLTLHLPDPIHLIAMKLQAARSPHRRNEAQDWQDVVELIIRQKLDLDEFGFQELIKSYGGADALERLRQEIQRREEQP